MRQNHADLKARAEAAVVRWQWATDRIYAPKPLWHERNQFRRGRWLKQAPSEEAHKYEYGLDESGRVHVERQHVRFTGFPERKWYYETFYFHGVNTLDMFAFDYGLDHDAIAFHRAQTVDGKIVLVESRGRGGVSRERYSWVGPHVVAVDIEHAKVALDGTYGELRPYARFTAAYDSRGLLDEIVRRWPKQANEETVIEEVVYKRPPKGVTLESSVRALQRALTAEIVRAVSRLNIGEPAYCIALAWSPGHPASLPCALAIGLESQRSRLLSRHPAYRALTIWNPAEFDVWVELSPRATPQLYQQVNQHCWTRGTWSRANKMLNDVACELSAGDLLSSIPRTSDFFVYVTDFELADLPRNLKRSCPPKILQSLKARGLLKGLGPCR